jgi:uncharacterized protein (DUF488 family)
MHRGIYTIGYVSFTVEAFLETLRRHEITMVADVRSRPYSQYRPEFNRDTLRAFLAADGIVYAFLGDECGARIDAPECYVGGKVDFNRVKDHPRFQEGLKRLASEMKSHRIAILCAEKDPMTCHRTILVARRLAELSDAIVVKHILADGSVENHREMEQRLLKAHKLDRPDLFRSEAERLEEAYDHQGAKIAYSEANDPGGREH